MLDAVNAWQLVREASLALDRPAAASFKHVSPAGAAVAGTVDEVMEKLFGIDARTIAPLTSAYVRARDVDPKSSYGDFIAVSDQVDSELADVLLRVPSDGIIAPDYDPDTLPGLQAKKGGRFVILKVEGDYQPPSEEAREIFGLRLTQPRDDMALTRDLLADVRCGTLAATALDDLLLGLIVLRYTQSNSVAYLRDGMVLGIGAGQQSRVDCTRLAGARTDMWWLRRHSNVRALAVDPTARIQDRISLQTRYLEGHPCPGAEPLSAREQREWLGCLSDVSYVSDGAIAFRDNIDHASRHGVRYIAEPGGSIRSNEVLAACQEHGIALAWTGLRLFHH